MPLTFTLSRFFSTNFSLSPSISQNLSFSLLGFSSAGFFSLLTVVGLGSWAPFLDNGGFFEKARVFLLKYNKKVETFPFFSSFLLYFHKGKFLKMCYKLRFLSLWSFDFSIWGFQFKFIDKSFNIFKYLGY